jgi:hypothetical protein
MALISTALAARKFSLKHILGGVTAATAIGGLAAGT